jgi:hypothetical protein
VVEDFVLIKVKRYLNVDEHDENKLWLDHLIMQMNFDELQQSDLEHNVQVRVKDWNVQRAHQYLNLEIRIDWRGGKTVNES